MSQRNERSTQPELSTRDSMVDSSGGWSSARNFVLEARRGVARGFRVSILGTVEAALRVGLLLGDLVIVNDQPRGRVPAASPVAPAKGFVTLAIETSATSRFAPVRYSSLRDFMPRFSLD
jgi:hypothetical protein